MNNPGICETPVVATGAVVGAGLSAGVSLTLEAGLIGNSLDPSTKGSDEAGTGACSAFSVVGVEAAVLSADAAVVAAPAPAFALAPLLMSAFKRNCSIRCFASSVWALLTSLLLDSFVCLDGVGDDFSVDCSCCV